MSSYQKSFFYSLLILTFVSVAYGTSIKGKWYFDDYPNIVYNVKLHIEDLKLSSLVSAATADPSKPKHSKELYRPVVLLSFAINYLLSGTDTSSYHVFNISIHLTTSIFLFLTLVKLLQSPRSTLTLSEHAEDIALIATLLWCLAPIQTQAVTYIVQRMASLAGMFTIMTIYFYCHLRETNKKKLFYSAIILILFILAIGSKENTILIPLNLLLVEYCFYNKLKISKKNITMFILVVTITYIIVAIMIDRINLLTLFTSSNARPFTSYERLLTEFRVLNYYIVQLIIPNANNLSLLHDITISTSLINPPTTLLSLLFILLLLSISLFYFNKYNILSYSILFFLINHSVESTFIPLELAFEHRNYIPSFFLFLPISTWLINNLIILNNSHLIKFTATCFICMYITTSVFNTIIRNNEWCDPLIFWHKEARLNQYSPRAALELGNQYLQRQNIELAIDLFNLALKHKNRMQNVMITESALLNGLGIAYFNQKDNARALQMFTQCLQKNPNDIKCWENKSITLMQVGKFDESHKTIDILLSHNPKFHSYNLIKGVIYLKEGLYENAIKQLERTYKILPTDRQTILHLSNAFLSQGNYHAGLSVLEQFSAIKTHDLQIILTKIYIYSKIENYEKLQSNIISLKMNLKDMPLNEIINNNTTDYGIELFNREHLLNILNK